MEDDLSATTRLPRRLLTTIYNPVITDELVERASEPPDHPWLVTKSRPVVLAAAGSGPQKNYPMLLRSFAQLRSRMDCRLVVLGEGPLLEVIASGNGQPRAQ